MTISEQDFVCSIVACIFLVACSFPRYGVVWCTLKRAKLSVIIVYVASFVVCLPNFATITMLSETFNTSASFQDLDMLRPGSDRIGTAGDVPYIETPGSETSAAAADADATADDDLGFTLPSNDTEPASWTLLATAATTTTASPASPSIVMWAVRFRRESDSERAMFVFNFWIQAIFVRLVPCVVLTLLSALLVRTMRRAAAKRRSLGAIGANGVSRPALRGPGAAWYRRWRQTNRTTRMLLTVVTLFLVTELPHSVVNIMSGVSDQFVEDVYMNLGDLFDILTLVNNGINFILYCTMSQQFRKTFVETFLSPRGGGRCSSAVPSRTTAGGGGGGGGVGGENGCGAVPANKALTGRKL